MTADELRLLQAQVKELYKTDPAAASRTLKAEGKLTGENLVCRVATDIGPADAGLHRAAGGNIPSVCSGDMLLQALVACAGVTVQAVATALSIPLSGGRVRAEGELDFRGTLGINKEVPVGFQSIRLSFELDTSATPEQLATLMK